MADNLAQTVSDVIFEACGGEFADELLSVDRAYRAVRSAYFFYAQAHQQSDQNQAIEKYEFALNGREQNLNNIGKGVLAWVERLIDRTSDTWVFVPPCNLDVLEEKHALGLPFWAVYGTAQGLHVKFSYNSSEVFLTEHRVWYDAEIAGAKMEAAPVFPSVFLELVKFSAIVKLIPQMMQAAAALEEFDNRVVSDTQKAAWQALAATAAAEVVRWEKLYENYVKNSRGSQRARNRTKQTELLGLRSRRF